MNRKLQVACAWRIKLQEAVLCTDNFFFPALVFSLDFPPPFFLSLLTSAQVVELIVVVAQNNTEWTTMESICEEHSC